MPSEQQLSDVLSEFARTLVTDFPIQAILDHLVKRIVDVMPISGAGVTLISPGTDPRYVAASNDAALHFEQLQSELGEGPCLQAYSTGEAVAIADLSTDPRFPTFSRRAAADGLAAAFTFPLRDGSQRLGALDLYRDTPGPLDARAMAAAQTLADVAAAYLQNAQARTDLQNASARSLQTSLHDGLTGLANRELLLERLEHAVIRSHRSGRMVAVLFADLDRFKLVNDLHGHTVGDELLVAISRRLTTILREEDTLARMSGDEFVILCEELESRTPVEAIAARVAKAFERPFQLSRCEVTIRASIGVAYSSGDDRGPEALLQDADAAMYQVKRQGGGKHGVLDLREQTIAINRGHLERDARGAAARGELHAEYQPIVDLHDGRVIGMEALLRWDHPTRGLVLPSTAIPLAERSDAIGEIGQWMIERGCIDLQHWHDDLNPLMMTVNVSAHELMSLEYPGLVAGLLAATHTDPRLLTLEMTETAFVQDSERAAVVLNELKEIGVGLALDDFGTGYSSLTYLKRYPIDMVKIDREFVIDMEHDPVSLAIVAALIDLAHALSMTVVAEGVETPAQRDHLAALGCDHCQGYYFARPMTVDDIDLVMGPDPAQTRLPALHGFRSPR